MDLDLILKAAAVLAMMITVGALTLTARRRNYEGLRRHYTTRRTRVRAQDATSPEAEPKPPNRTTAD
ncbi:hypothetical protein L6R52_05945 [Myxococcota bacterium]|nr:hypothetical protein [Myxococcota bacterium]